MVFKTLTDDDDGVELSPIDELPHQIRVGGVVASIKEFSIVFWLYCCTGMFMFGCMVPFWFIGSKFFQAHKGYDVAAADALMILPEGIIVLVAPPLGFYLDRMNVSVQAQFMMMMAGLLAIAASYLLLILSSLPPLAPMLVLGAAYSVANVCYWAVIPKIAGQHLMALAGGLVGATINVLPAIVPLALVHVDRAAWDPPVTPGSVKLGVLAGLGTLGAICAA
eukprot:CAMPEP_0118931680 /NCGR_PEP_ID=MMETSP1169-20130426/7937_1 /TAXON_ID=36882 /ORGANISM="Pyramimonas obovata, Strain CCMP722" /LENGTH=221 /DNA_ID=CAMNT_0006874207 /DNA_START=819 /DNA_END=1480 /DNA_ORIENTATION=-